MVGLGAEEKTVGKGITASYREELLLLACAAWQYQPRLRYCDAAMEMSPWMADGAWMEET
jgi:hypothetical protein